MRGRTVTFTDSTETGTETENDNGETIEELCWWLAILREAGRHHARLDAPTRADIDAGHSERELSRMAVHMADVSTRTRLKIERTLLTAIAELGGVLPVSPHAVCRRLAPVPDVP